MLTLLLLLACDGEPDETGLEPTVEAVSWAVHQDIGSIVRVEWTQSRAAEIQVDYTWEGGADSTPVRALQPGSHEALLLGVPYDADLQFSLVVDGRVLEARSAHTDALHEDAPLPTLVDAVDGAWDAQGRYLLLSVNQVPGGWTTGLYWLYFIDRQGRVVWAHRTPDMHWTLFSQVSRDGTDILWDEFTFWSNWDLGAASAVHRMKIDGSVVQTVATPGGHHAFVELPDGSIVWGAAQGWTSENLVRWTPGQGKRTLWSCGLSQRDGGEKGFCQSNALFWDEASGDLLYSFYSSSSVLRLSPDTGEVYETYGHLPSSWTFDPPESAFWWQHGTKLTHEGTLLVSTHASLGTPDVVVREYRLDEGVLTQIWSHGEGDGLVAHYNGDVQRLPGGNTVHNHGSGSRLLEITPEGEVVWELEFGEERMIGRSEWVSDLHAFLP